MKLHHKGTIVRGDFDNNRSDGGYTIRVVPEFFKNKPTYAELNELMSRQVTVTIETVATPTSLFAEASEKAHQGNTKEAVRLAIEALQQIAAEGK
jgi:hypothetical protein